MLMKSRILRFFSMIWSCLITFANLIFSSSTVDDHAGAHDEGSLSCSAVTGFDAGHCEERPTAADRARKVRGLQCRRQDYQEPLQPKHDINLRPRLFGILYPLATAQNEHRDVAFLIDSRMAEQMGWRRGLQRHVSASGLPCLFMGCPSNRSRKLGMRADILRARLSRPNKLRGLELWAEMATVVG